MNPARQIVCPRCSSASSPPFPLFITQCPIVVLLFFLELRLIPTEKELGPKRKPAARNPVRIWCGHIESTKAIVIEATRTIQTNQINKKNKKKFSKKGKKLIKQHQQFVTLETAEHSGATKKMGQIQGR